MAAKPKVEVVGLPRLKRTIEAAVDDLDDMDRAITQTQSLVLGEARRRAPKRTGALAASLRSAGEKNAAYVGSDLVYALPIHWGWRARGIRPSLFLLTAAEETQGQWVGFFEDDVKTAVGKVKGK